MNSVVVITQDVTIIPKRYEQHYPRSLLPKYSM